MIRNSQLRAAETLLDLLGVPAPARNLWCAAGVRRFIRGWSAIRPGSVAELELILGLVDSMVQVRWWVTSDRRVRLVIHWSRWSSATDRFPAERAQQLAATAQRIIKWWTPLGVGVAWDMTWPGVPLLAISGLTTEETTMTIDKRQLVSVAEELLGVRRLPPVPPRTWIGLEADAPIRRSRHELRLANPHLDRFLVNVGPWRATVRVDQRIDMPGRIDLRMTALCRSSVLEFVAHPGSVEALRLNGKAIQPAPISRWPEYCRFPLDEPLEPGREYRISCDSTHPSEAPIWVNPALFEAARYDAQRRAYVRDIRFDREEAGAFPDLVAGAPGIVRHHQPFAVPAATPAESDERMLARARRIMLGRQIARRSDLQQLIQDLVPGVDAVQCIEMTWTAEENGWLVPVRGLHVRLRPAIPAENMRLRVAAERFLRKHLPPALPVRVEVADGSEQ